IGECERIQNTPLPFAYVVHLRRALVLYLLTLPFALVDTFGWTTVLYTFLISYTLLGIDEIGVEIENPFGTDHNDLPLEHICDVVRRDLLSEDIVSAPPPNASSQKSTL
ncbi:MAG TPA: bestrophin family ion channel, partial [Opitutaceae bacterium]|nr:bestrophin family ion channel [Opitutaceae bacterium]